MSKFVYKKWSGQEIEVEADDYVFDDSGAVTFYKRRGPEEWRNFKVLSVNSNGWQQIREIPKEGEEA